MDARKPTVLIVGTLDSKGEELSFLRQEILRRECNCIVMDVGCSGKPAFEADILREEVAERGGYPISYLSQKSTERGMAIDTMIRGGALAAREMLAEGKFDGIIALGGGTGTTIGTLIMQELPFGVPKVQISTLPGNFRDTRRFFGQKDIMMLNSMVDLVGLNSITRTLIEEGAGAITGMVRYKPNLAGAKRSVVITCLGVTTPGVMKVRQRLIERGKEVIVLHGTTKAVGELVAAGMVEMMLDLTPNDFIDYLKNEDGTPDLKRLGCIRAAGIPLVVAPGGLDVILCAMPADNLPQHLKGRPVGIHTEFMTLVGTTAEEKVKFGRIFGEMLCESAGPIGAVIPEGGISARSCEGTAFHDPDAVEAFAQGLGSAAPDRLVIHKTKAHINDEEFADTVMNVIDEIMRKGE